jgi:hypothetical protein
VLGNPLVLEQGDVDLIAPVALKPLVADEVRFLAHPEPGTQSKRCLIPRIDPCDHTVKAEMVKGQMEKSMSSLSGVTASRKVRVKHPADLAAAMLGAPKEEHHVPDQLPSIHQLDAKRQSVTLGGDRSARPALSEPVRHHIRAHRLERHKPTDLFKRPVRDQGIDIGFRQWPQEKTRRDDGIFGRELHESMIPDSRCPASRTVSCVVRHLRRRRPWPIATWRPRAETRGSIWVWVLGKH